MPEKGRGKELQVVRDLDIQSCIPRHFVNYKSLACVFRAFSFMFERFMLDVTMYIGFWKFGALFCTVGYSIGL